MTDETASAPRCAYCSDAGVMGSREVAKVQKAPFGWITTYRTWLRLCECVDGSEIVTEPVCETYIAAISVHDPYG